jgi:hypothetical protein
MALGVDTYGEYYGLTTDAVDLAYFDVGGINPQIVSVTFD